MISYFFVRADSKFVCIRFAEILYIEALKNYKRIVTERETYLVLITMKRMEEELPKSSFCRVHRSFIISLDHIAFFDNESIRLREKTIPISPHYKDSFFQKINIVQEVSDHEFSITQSSIL